VTGLAANLGRARGSGDRRRLAVDIAATGKSDRLRSQRLPVSLSLGFALRFGLRFNLRFDVNRHLDRRGARLGVVVLRDAPGKAS